MWRETLAKWKRRAESSARRLVRRHGAAPLPVKASGPCALLTTVVHSSREVCTRAAQRFARSHIRAAHIVQLGRADSGHANAS
jgi:hypothetical protein